MSRLEIGGFNKRVIIRAALLWLIVSGLAAGWLLYNVYVLVTPRWLDGLFGAGIVLLLILAAGGSSRKPGNWETILSSVYILYAGLAGLFYLLYYYAPVRSPWHSLIPLPLLYANTLFDILNAADRSGGKISAIQWLLFAGYFLFLGLAAVIAAYAFRIVWQALWSRLASPLEAALRRFFPRAGRIKQGLGWCGVVVIAALILVILSLVLSNLNAPVIQANSQVVAAIPSYLRMNDLIIDSQDGTVYAGTDGGVFRSANGGRSWEAANTGLDSMTVNALVLNSQDGVLYAGTGGGIFRSMDGGRSWLAIGSDFTGTNVTALVMNGSDGSLYAGTGGGNGRGVFRSTDGGRSWAAASKGLTDRNVSDLIIDSRNGALYAGTSSFGGGDHVFRSLDGGRTWAETGNGLNNVRVSALIVDLEEGILYAGTYGDQMVYRSADNGSSWVAANDGSIKTSVYTLALDNRDGTLYAGTGDGVFRSSDGGRSWEAASSGLTGRDVSTLAIDSRDGGQVGLLYAGTFGSGVFRSADGGRSWEQARSGLTGTYVSALALDRRDSTLYAGTYGGGVFRSADGGRSWEAASSCLTNTLVRVLALDIRDGTLYAGTDDGVFRSTDGGRSWAAASSGLNGKLVRALALDTGSGALYAGTNGGVFPSTNGGRSWDNSANGLTGMEVSSLALDARNGGQNGVLYAGNYGGGVFRSADGGRSWEPASSGMTNKSVRALALDERDGTLYAGTDGGGVLRSADGGRSWEPASSGMAATDVRTLALDDRDGILYAGTNGGGVFRSADGGRSWEPAISGMTSTGVNALAHDSRDGALYAGTGGGLFRSADGGRSWTAAGSGLTDTDISALALGSRDGGQDGALYAGNYGSGVFRSADGGRSWDAASSGITNTKVNALAFDVRDGALYAGTDGGGAFRSTDGGRSWDNASSGLNGNFVRDLALDTGGGALYAGTNLGVYRSTDGGRSWEAASGGLTSTSVRALAFNHWDGALYVWTYQLDVFSGRLSRNSLFRSADGGRSWEAEGFNLRSIAPLRGYVFRLSAAGPLVWAEETNPVLWGQFSEQLGLFRAGIAHDSMGRPILLDAWGATILRAEIPPAVRPIPGIWLVTRAWVTYVFIPWLSRNGLWLAGSVLGLALVLTAREYLRDSRPLGVPILPFLFSPDRQAAYASKEKLAEQWGEWQSTIRGELARFGDVQPVDLQSIPGPFRRYALERFYEAHKEDYAIEYARGRMALKTGDRLKEWRAAWAGGARAVGATAGMNAAGRSAAGQMARLLAKVLEFNLLEGREFQILHAYRVEAPSMRLNVPRAFPLVFLADPRPGEGAVQALFNAVEVLKERGSFALVVPLEPRGAKLDIPAELRRLVKSSPYAQDFIILSREDVVEILIARDPLRVLAGQIGRQRSLTQLSPFVVNGPVPEGMFVGREQELRALQESAGRLDTSVIGNRKIGKTSLLNRLAEKLRLREGVFPMRIDCQPLADAGGFLRAFCAAAGQAYTGQGVADLPELVARLRAEKKAAPVFLLDEVELLLDKDAQAGEGLAAAWRALAQAGECHFVFFGSGGLARRLSDPHSAFFNFTQRMPLRYLSAAETRMLLDQPLGMLGIQVENAEAFHAKALALTSGHPNLAQYVGRELVEAANRREERRVLPGDLAEIERSPAFVDFYFETVWGAASPLEKLVTLLAPEGPFRAGEIEDALAKEGVAVEESALDGALKLLCVYSILQQDGPAYRFFPQAFYPMLHANLEVRRLVRIEKNKLPKGASR